MGSRCDSGFNFSAVPPTSPPFCWVITDREEKNAIVLDEALAVFSKQEMAQSFISRNKIPSCRTKLLSWEVIVRKFKGTAQKAVLDFTGDKGYYKVVALT